jgi:hypothetical protein
MRNQVARRCRRLSSTIARRAEAYILGKITKFQGRRGGVWVDVKRLVDAA